MTGAPIAMPAPVTTPRIMRERPILMSGPMVVGALASWKTKTRRAITPPPALIDGALYWRSPRYDNGDGVDYLHTDEASARRLMVRACPYGQPGDRLWVRESFYCDDYRYPDAPPSELLSEMYYRADGEPGWEGGERTPWRPSIHMPQWACRLVLEVTEVRVERLHEITEADVIAEGIRRVTKDGHLWKYGVADRDGYPGGIGWEWADWEPSAVEAFRTLWDSLNRTRAGGTYRWDANPWVWVVSFRRAA